MISQGYAIDSPGLQGGPHGIEMLWLFSWASGVVLYLPAWRDERYESSHGSTFRERIDISTDNCRATRRGEAVPRLIL